MVENIGGKIFQREGGDLEKVTSRLRGEPLAAHIDAERVTRFFGKQHNIKEQIVRVGVSVDVWCGHLYLQFYLTDYVANIFFKFNFSFECAIYI